MTRTINDADLLTTLRALVPGGFDRDTLDGEADLAGDEEYAALCDAHAAAWMIDLDATGPR